MSVMLVLVGQIFLHRLFVGIFSVLMRVIFPLLFVVVLSACGGGGSSGGVSFVPQFPGDTLNVPPTQLVPNTKPAPDALGKKVVKLGWQNLDERENGA